MAQTEVATDADTGVGGHPLGRNRPGIQYGRGDPIRYALWSGEVKAAQERHEAGLDAQQADGLGDALAATLRARTAGDAALADAERTAEYLGSQAGRESPVASDAAEEAPADSGE